MDSRRRLSAVNIVTGDRSATLPLFHHRTIQRSDYTTILLNSYATSRLYHCTTIPPYHYPTKQPHGERRFLLGSME